MRAKTVSLHASTAMDLAAELTGAKFRRTEAEGGAVVVECDGIGWGAE